MRKPEKHTVLRLIIQGNIQGKRSERRRISWVKNLKQWLGETNQQLFRATKNEIMMADMLENVIVTDC